MEVVIISKKILFSSVLVFMSDIKGKAQLVVMILINITYTLILIIMKPYKIKILNTLRIFSMITVGIVSWGRSLGTGSICSGKPIHLEGVSI